jgi:p-aminobenzoyl-glutamate transporter AbgT
MPKPASVLQLGKLQITHKVPTHGAPSPFMHAVQNIWMQHFMIPGLVWGGGGSINSSIMWNHSEQATDF